MCQGVNQKLRALSDEAVSIVRGIAQGPLVLDFYGALSGSGSEFKQIAFVKGMRSARDENHRLILSALSRESADFIQT